MTDFTTHTKTTAPAASLPLLERAAKAYSFIPNLLATMATSPQLLEAYMAVSALLDKTPFTETERQIILMTNNRLNGCRYCMAAHTTISQMAGVKADVIEALRTGSPLRDSKLEALRTFAVVINETRGWPGDADVEAFLAAGYTKEAVLNVVLATALKVMSNYTNHIAATPIDDAFSASAWAAETAA